LRYYIIENYYLVILEYFSFLSFQNLTLAQICSVYLSAECTLGQGVLTMTKSDPEIEHTSAVTLEQQNQSSKTLGRTEISTGDERRAGVPTYSLKAKRKQTAAGRRI